MAKVHEVGSVVMTFLKISSGKKVKVKGTIKEVKKNQFGKTTYIINNAVVIESFPTRTIK